MGDADPTRAKECGQVVPLKGVREVFRPSGILGFFEFELLIIDVIYDHAGRCK